MPVICERCGQAMAPGVSCVAEYVVVKGVARRSKRFEPDTQTWYDLAGNRVDRDPPACHDCGMPLGGYHHEGCELDDLERVVPIVPAATPVRLGRDELVRLVQQILDAPEELTEDDESALVLRFRQSVPHPRAGNLIFWPEDCGLGPDPTAEKIVDAALSYTAIPLPGPPAGGARSED